MTCRLEGQPAATGRSPCRDWKVTHKGRLQAGTLPALLVWAKLQLQHRQAATTTATTVTNLSTPLLSAGLHIEPDHQNSTAMPLADACELCASVAAAVNTTSPPRKIASTPNRETCTVFPLHCCRLGVRCPRAASGTYSVPAPPLPQLHINTHTRSHVHTCVPPVSHACPPVTPSGLTCVVSPR